MAGTIFSAIVFTSSCSCVPLSTLILARAQRPGWEARWGSEEPARVAATPTTSAVASEAGAPGATAPADAHPSYLGECPSNLCLGLAGCFACFVSDYGKHGHVLPALSSIGICAKACRAVLIGRIETSALVFWTKRHGCTVRSLRSPDSCCRLSTVSPRCVVFKVLGSVVRCHQRMAFPATLQLRASFRNSCQFIARVSFHASFS